MHEILDAYEQKTEDVCRVACDQLCGTELVGCHPIRREEGRNGSDSKKCQ